MQKFYCGGCDVAYHYCSNLFSMAKHQHKVKEQYLKHIQCFLLEFIAMQRCQRFRQWRFFSMQERSIIPVWRQRVTIDKHQIQHKLFIFTDSSAAGISWSMATSTCHYQVIQPSVLHNHIINTALCIKTKLSRNENWETIILMTTSNRQGTWNSNISRLH